MSYLDPSGAPEPRGWERPGDQWDPDRAGRDDPRPQAWPDGTRPASYPGDPDQRAGARYGAGAGYGPPPGYEPAASYEPGARYDTRQPYEVPASYDTASPYDAASPYAPPAGYDTATGYDGDRTGYDTSTGFDGARTGQATVPHPETARPQPVDPRYGFDPDPAGPTAYRQSAAAPVSAAPPSWDGTSSYRTGPHRYQPDGRGADPYPSDPYPADPYPADPYPADPYPADPYPADPHPSEPYLRDRYPSDAYPPDRSPEPRRYASGDDDGPGLAGATDPVGWAPIGAVPSRTGRDIRPGPDPRPGTDPFADTQNLPRVGAAPTGDPADRTTGAAPGSATTDGQPAAKPTGRAGRNLPAAIGVGLALGALIVIPLFVYPLAFLFVIAAAASVGTWEFTRAVRRGSGVNPPLPPLLGGGLLMVGLAWWAGPDALSLALLVTILATLIWRLGDGPKGFQRDLTAATLIAVYVPFLGGFAALLTAVPDDGHLRVLVTLVAVVLSDTGGYAAGVTLGRHPMAPSVSPKKSWEGFAGSVVAAAAGSAILLWVLLDVAPIWGALFGVAVSVSAVLGDLGESMIKRDIGVKDMSNLLPGHGGLMDRLDSVLFAMPVAYLLLALFAPAG